MDYTNAVKRLFIDAARASLDLFKIMVPIVVAVKILQELDLIKYLAVPLAPMMELVGLPAETGLVLGTAILNTIYSAIIVYVSLLPQIPTLTVAQITVLATMILIAHNLPVEVRIVQKCGVGFWGQFFLRLVGGFACGALMYLVFDGFDLLTQPSAILFEAEPPEASIPLWAWGQLKNLGSIFLVILSLMGLMRVLKHLGVIDLMIRLLNPVLVLLGIGKEAAAITIIGLTMGIAYGGGLIIHEVKKGNLDRRDVFAAVSLMGLTHALIEDSLLMLLLGASLYGIFWGRLAFSLIVVAILTRLVHKYSRDKTEKPTMS